MATKQPKWKSFPASDEDFDYAGPALNKHWARLHLGDCEPFPDAAYVKKLFETSPELKTKVPVSEAAETLQSAWQAYHRGDFQKAAELGLGLGRLGYNVANKAANIYATYLEEDKERKLALLLDCGSPGRDASAIRAGPGQRLVFPRPGAGALQPGHLGCQGARRRAWRQDQGEP